MGYLLCMGNIIVVLKLSSKAIAWRLLFRRLSSSKYLGLSDTLEYVIVEL